MAHHPLMRMILTSSRARPLPQAVLTKPGHYRVALTANNGRHLMSRLGPEGHQSPGLTLQPKPAIGSPIRKDECAAIISLISCELRFAIQKYTDRDAPPFIRFHSHHAGVPVLMRHEKISHAITKKLRRFTSAETKAKPLLQRRAIFV